MSGSNDDWKARAEKAEAEVERVRKLIDRDRTGLAAALNAVRGILRGYGWLAEDGVWGSYDYTQQTVSTLRKEIGWMMDAAMKIIEDGLHASGNRANAAFHPEAAASTVPAPKPKCATCDDTGRVNCPLYPGDEGNECDEECPSGGDPDNCTIPCPNCGPKGG